MHIRMLIGALRIRIAAKKAIPALPIDPVIVKVYAVKRQYTFDINSPEDRLAQESLVFVSTNNGTNTYTDDGITANAAYFEELCSANRTAINKYYADQLKRRNLNY